MRKLTLVYRSSQKLGFFKKLLQCDGHAERSSGKVLSLCRARVMGKFLLWGF
jgi:hypothetical protein